MDLLKSRLLPARSAEPDSLRREKRRFRRSAVFATAVIESAGKMYEGHVLSISTGGALMRINQPFSPHGVFTISIDGSEPVKAALTRSNTGNHGITFREDPERIDMIIADLLTGKGGGKELRVHPRRLVRLSGSFYLGDQRVDCTVQNISLGGASVRSDEIVPPGTPFELNIARFGTIPSRAMRLDPSGMGCLFVAEPEEVLQRIGHLLPDPKR